MNTFGADMLRSLHLLLFLLLAVALKGQQAPDTLYSPPYFKPFFEKGKGPEIFIDAYHHNFHRLHGGYTAFAKLLEKDGYVFQSLDKEFTSSALKAIKILVIANALNEVNMNNWDLPNPSAFTEQEIKDLSDWVKKGGSLFLIADHMPFAGAASELAKSFGFTFYNGFLRDTLNKRNGDVFTKTNGLFSNKITEGVDTIITFTGQTFDIPKEASSIININERFTIFLPNRAWVFDQSTKRISGSGKSQLAMLEFGKGRVLVSGEAAMFTAQTSNGAKVGMNSPRAKQNYLLLIDIMRWLSKAN